MVTQNTMGRAYEGLSMPERVALAFHFHAHDNELEVLRLRDAIPKSAVGRPMQALAYGVERWRSVSAFYAINYWRLRALANEAIVAMHMTASPGLEKMPADAPWTLVDHAIALHARLVALDSALDTVCAENGIDPADIRHVSASEPYLLMPNVEPEAGFEREMVEAMRTAIE